MAPAVFVDLGFEAAQKPRRVIVVGSAAGRAVRTSLGTPHPPDRARQTRRWQSASPASPILIFSAHAFLVQIGPKARHRRLGMAKNL
jgi:hypothetical protein